MEEVTVGVEAQAYMQDIMKVLADRFNHLNSEAGRLAAEAGGAKDLLERYIVQCAASMGLSADDYTFNYATATFVRKAEHESGPAQP